MESLVELNDYLWAPLKNRFSLSQTSLHIAGMSGKAKSMDGYRSPLIKIFFRR